MKKFFAFMFIVCIICLPSQAFGWKTLKTDRFVVFYKDECEAQAWKFLKTLEHYRPKVEYLIGNTAFKLPVIIEDMGTMTNGMTDPLNYKMFLYTYPPSYPPSGTEIGSIENWESDVSVHEYTHLLHLTKCSGFPEGLVTLFGNLFCSNVLSPGWIVEGITVYSESQLSSYQGRLNDGYYDAYVGARVKDGRFPSILEAAYPPMEYPYGDGIYNYGSVFFNYLSKTYGEESFSRFFENYGSSIPLFMLDSSAKQTYGKSFSALWKDWRQYESERFKDFRMEDERLTQHGWYVSNPAIFNGKLYYARTNLKKTGTFNRFSFTKIIERDITTGSERSIVSTTSFFTTSIKIHDSKLYYGVAEIKPGYANVSLSGYGVYSVVHEKDLLTGDDRVILKDSVRDFEVLNDRSILYSRDKSDSFGSEIVLLNKGSDEGSVLFETDMLIDGFVSDGKRIIVSARRDWQNFSLYDLNLQEQKLTPLVENHYFAGHHSLCGDKVFFTSNYEGIYSSYCYELPTGKLYRLTENGFSDSPVFDEKSQTLYHIGLNSYGYDIYAKNVEWKEYSYKYSDSTKPPVFSLSESEVRRGGYLDNLKTIMPKLRLPLFRVDEDESSLGVFMMGEDALGHFPYSAIAMYDLKSREPIYDVSLGVNILAPLSASLSSSNMNEEKQLGVTLQYPLLVRLSPGISNVSLGISSRLFDDFNRHELMPYLGIGFQFPTTSFSLDFGTPLERTEIGSDMDRTALKSILRLRQYIWNSEANIKISGVHDPDSTYDPEEDEPEESPFPVIRGYDDPLPDKIGASFSLDLSAPILPVRRGLWFPPYIFFEDICGGIFFDGAFSKDENYQLSTGSELHIETNLAMWLPLDIGVRVVVNREEEVKVQPIVNIAVSF